MRNHSSFIFSLVLLGIPIGIFMGISLTLLTAYFRFSYLGFCFEKMRYLSDEEMIRSVFDEINTGAVFNDINTEQGLNTGARKNYKFIKYQSFDEYIKENPDCCKVNYISVINNSFKPSFAQRILGDRSDKMVQINFKVRYLDEKGKLQS
jgi:hypothetical protein